MKTMMKVVGFMVVLFFVEGSVVSSLSSAAPKDSPKKERIKKSGWIGVKIQDVDEKIAHKYKLDSEEGAYVREVIEESPADSAGIKEGDVIIKFDDTNVLDAEDLVRAVQRTQPGTKINLTFVRNGEKKSASLTVGKIKKPGVFHSFRMPTMPHIQMWDNSCMLGLKLMDLNEQLGEYFGAPNNEGVLVEEVEKGSTGEDAGFKAGDIVVRVGKRSIAQIEDISRELRKHEEGEKVEFEVLRKGAKKTFNVEIEDNQDSNWNYFFHTPKPHIRMFRSRPLDDIDLQIQMDEVKPQLDQMRIEIEGRMQKEKVQKGEWQDQIHNFFPFKEHSTAI